MSTGLVGRNRQANPVLGASTMTKVRPVRHPITMFVMAIVAVIGIGVGVLVATIGSSQPRTYAVEGFLRAVGGAPLGPDYVRLTGRIRFVSTSSPGSAYYTHAVDGRWTARLPPGTYNVSGRSNGVEFDNPFTGHFSPKSL